MLDQFGELHDLRSRYHDAYVRLQDARTQELNATYQNQVLKAAQEVQTALRGFLRSQEQSDSLARSAAAAVAATQIEENLFRTLKADVNRLFTLENTQLQVQDQLAVAQGNIALNLINVYRALGGRLGDPRAWVRSARRGVFTRPAPVF